MCSPGFISGSHPGAESAHGQYTLLLFPRPHCPHILCQDTGFQACLTSGIPRALLTQVLPGAGPEPAAETLRVWSLIYQSQGLPGPAFRAAPPGSAVLTVSFWARCWVSLSWSTLVYSRDSSDGEGISQAGPSPQVLVVSRVAWPGWSSASPREVSLPGPCDVMLGFLVLPNKHPGPALCRLCHALETRSLDENLSLGMKWA